ncbi:MAG: hypothetical protein KC502_15365 [Myxococcales bacterium]|nr:hypothetical protein [Myxococcales bacterium]
MWLAPILPTLTALWLCRIPGFDLLDYHACLALAPVMGLCAAHGIGSRTSPWTWALLVLGPLAILLGNAWWVPNCAPMTGLAFYGLGPLLSVVVGLCIGRIASALAPTRMSRTIWLIAVLSMVPAAVHFLRHPQVFAYHGLVGWIGGALYEDALAPHATYVWFRLVDTSTWVAAAVWATHGPSEKPTSVRRTLVAATRMARGRFALLWLICGLLVGQLAGAAGGWRVDQADIERELATAIELRLDGGDAPNVVIHLRSGKKQPWQLHLIAEDVAVRWLELRAFFGTAPGKSIDVYLYPDVAAKRRLMGAARVEMAKPWLRQVHMVWPGWGRTITRHELAHVFAGVDAPPPFAVPLRGGFWPDALVIEGLAVAAEWPMRSGLDPHHWSAAMRRLRLAPPMSDLMAPTGFFRQSSARAYTLAGSLLRWLRDTHGAGALAKVTRDGDLAAATGVPLPDLLASWAQYVDALPLRAVDLQRARARFERTGLFYRPCSLEIGRCRERARAAWRANDPQRALQQWKVLRQRVASHAKGRPLGLDIELAYAFALAEAGQGSEAISALSAQLSGPGRLTELQRARINRLIGDVQNKPSSSLRRWRSAAQAPLSDGELRLLLVKQQLAQSPGPGRKLVTDALLATASKVSYGKALAQTRRQLPNDPIVTYLYARRRRLGPAGTRAALDLAAALPALTTWPLLYRETLRMLAERASRAAMCEGVWVLAEAAGSQRPEVGAWRSELTERCAQMRRLHIKPWLTVVEPRTEAED